MLLINSDKLSAVFVNEMIDRFAPADIAVSETFNNWENLSKMHNSYAISNAINFQ